MGAQAGGWYDGRQVIRLLLEVWSKNWKLELAVTVRVKALVCQGCQRAARRRKQVPSPSFQALSSTPAGRAC